MKSRPGRWRSLSGCISTVSTVSTTNWISFK
jgi:hypothetical protein